MPQTEVQTATKTMAYELHRTILASVLALTSLSCVGAGENVENGGAADRPSETQLASMNAEFLAGMPRQLVGRDDWAVGGYISTGIERDSLLGRALNYLPRTARDYLLSNLHVELIAVYSRDNGQNSMEILFGGAVATDLAYYLSKATPAGHRVVNLDVGGGLLFAMAYNFTTGVWTYDWDLISSLGAPGSPVELGSWHLFPLNYADEERNGTWASVEFYEAGAIHAGGLFFCSDREWREWGEAYVQGLRWTEDTWNWFKSKI